LLDLLDFDFVVDAVRVDQLSVYVLQGKTSRAFGCVRQFAISGSVLNAYNLRRERVLVYIALLAHRRQNRQTR